MESWQGAYINKNRVDLQNNTNCTTQLLDFLGSNDILTQEEIEHLVSLI